MKVIETVVLVGNDAHQVEDQIELAIKRVNRKLSAKKQISYVRSEDSITIEAEPMQFFAIGEEFNLLEQKKRAREKTGKKAPKEIVIHFDKEGKVKNVCCEVDARVTFIDDRELSKATSESEVYFSIVKADAISFDVEDFEWVVKEKLRESLERVNKETWVLNAEALNGVASMRDLLFFSDEPHAKRSGWFVKMMFDSREEAIDYLQHRVELWFATNGTPEQKKKMLFEASNGSLIWHGIECTITKLEENV
jgi:hypothetical protein